MSKFFKIMILLLSFYMPSEFSCSFSIAPLNFGIYSPLASGDPLISTNITVQGCLLALLANYKFTAGNSNNYGQRYLKNTNTLITDQLNYNIYTDSGRTQVWGDGTQGSTTFYQLLAISLTPYNIPVYGKMIAKQGVSPGLYTDTIQLFITF